ncbi:MAG: hypothetical protein JO006_18540 [Paucibacter sp.]|nr:hypothetical protein [Roseateles sp.]
MSRFVAPRPNASALLQRQAKPRNPLVAPALKRLAGRHQTGNLRQQATRQLREQLKTLDSP